MPPFPVYLEGDIETSVQLISRSRSLPVQEEQINALTSFTLTIFSDIFNKRYEADDTHMSYWLAPPKLPLTALLKGDFDAVVDVELLTMAEQAGSLEWLPGTSPQAWLDRFLVDKWSGAFRYFSAAVVHGATKDSPIHTHTAVRPRRGNTVLEYTLSFYGKNRQAKLETCDKDQPVFAVEVVQLKRNFLDMRTEQEKADQSYAEVCPEPLRVSVLPCTLVRTLLVLPAIVSRLDSFCIALEAFENLNLAVPAELALEALTKDSDNTMEHREQQIHSQRGMGKNYERLEVEERPPDMSGYS